MGGRGHVRLPNDLAQMDGITDAQLGLLVRLLSLPPGWETTTEQLIKPGDGRDKIRSGVRALEALGLLTRREYRDETGKYRQTWTVRDTVPGTETDSQASSPAEPKSTATDFQGRSAKPAGRTATDSQGRDGFSGPDRDGFSGPDRDGFSGPYIQATNTTTGDTGVAVATHVTEEPWGPSPPPIPGEEPERTCERHLGHVSPPPCGGCADARRAHTRWELARSKRREWVELEHSRQLRREFEESERRRSRQHSKHVEEIRAMLSTPKRQPCYDGSTESVDPEEGNAMIRRRKAAG